MGFVNVLSHNQDVSSIIENTSDPANHITIYQPCEEDEEFSAWGG